MAANYYANKVTSEYTHNEVHHCEMSIAQYHVDIDFFATKCYVISILSVSKLDQLQIIR